jgi:hypothetical protein
MTPEEKQKTPWGICFCCTLHAAARTTAIPPPPAVPGSTGIGPGPHSWRHKATLLPRAFNHSQARWVSTATELPMKLRFCGTAANDSFGYSHYYSFDWRIDEKGFTLTVLPLKVYGLSSCVRTYITECRAILRRERESGRVHTTISHGMSRKIYVQCVFVASQFTLSIFFGKLNLYSPQDGHRQNKIS